MLHLVSIALLVPCHDILAMKLVNVIPLSKV